MDIDGAVEGPSEAAASCFEEVGSLECGVRNASFSARVAEQPYSSSATSTRMCALRPGECQELSSSQAMAVGPSRSEGGPQPLPPASNELLTEEALVSRLIKICVHEGVGPMRSGGSVIKSGVTIEFCVHAKPAAKRVKQQYASSTAMAPERPDLHMDEVQLMGYLAGDIYERELLQGEAREVGQAIEDRCRAEKAKKAAAAEKAKAARKRARKKSGSEAEQLLRDIETDVVRDRALRLATETDIKLPLANTKLVDIKVAPSQPPPKPSVSSVVDELTKARAALTTAQAAHVQAELELKRAKRALARLEPPSFSGPSEFDWVNATDEALEAHCAATKHLVESESNFNLTAELLRLAEGDVAFELKMAEIDIESEALHLQAHTHIHQQLLEQQHTMQLAVAAAAAERAEAEREQECLDVWRASRRWRALVKRSHMSAAFAEIEAAESRDRTRERLLADAARVWGTAEGSDTKAPSNVINLDGMSVEDLRSAACDRGVRVGVEYKVTGRPGEYILET